MLTHAFVACNPKSICIKLQVTEFSYAFLVIFLVLLLTGLYIRTEQREIEIYQCSKNVFKIASFLWTVCQCIKTKSFLPVCTNALQLHSVNDSIDNVVSAFIWYVYTFEIMWFWIWNYSIGRYLLSALVTKIFIHEDSRVHEKVQK